ncbi:MAG: tRNA preQ1(34) S-adenosylmethionine ribosyltransferase-isomerase QueA [Chrysiogenales bacterium]|nr:MAG: tRNA preQ1(34) S-adenosylmethionine ribosyltransferase-isomerase QueA [Chrysiogenales bacterium]
MRDDEYSLDDFDFELPPELIAQEPAEKRDESRLLVLDRATGKVTHSRFSRISEFLRPGDLLVFNDARVMHARVPCMRESGGAVELILLAHCGNLRWTAISNRTKKLKPGGRLIPLRGEGVEFRITGRVGDIIELETNVPLTPDALDSIGVVPLPPYITREAAEYDMERYQTVYARASGAVAAPTAGLHFTDDLLRRIDEMGVQTEFVTLLVSWGTFQPVRSKNIAEHKMHFERFDIRDETAVAINKARIEGRRVVAVGTTSLRVLESTFHSGRNIPGEGDTNIFIRPPGKVLSIDALITNFHTPRSTLLMLVSAFAGHDTVMAAYREAVEMRYRFFSYGDAMFII